MSRSYRKSRISPREALLALACTDRRDERLERGAGAVAAAQWRCEGAGGSVLQGKARLKSQSTRSAVPPTVAHG